MLSSVLKGDRAAEVNVAIMRTFVKMRRILAGSNTSKACSRQFPESAIRSASFMQRTGPRYGV
jgi:hypothetical protein